MNRAVINLQRAIFVGLALCGFVLPAGGATYQLLSPDQSMVGHTGIYLTAKDETLLDTARRYGFGYTEFMAANRGVDPWLSPEGTSVSLPGLHILPDADRRGVVINLASQRLFYFPAGEKKVVTFPIGISRPGRDTPLGKTSVVRKAANPTWYPPPSARADDPSLPGVVPPGPDNPLGGYALYLGWPRYLIHGTNKPDGVGRTVSNGCVRLYPEDIAQIFEQVPVGTPVQVMHQEALVTWIGENLYAQVFPTKKQADEISIHGYFTSSVPSSELKDRVIAAMKQRDVAINWEAVDKAGLERSGLPVLIGQASNAF